MTDDEQRGEEGREEAIEDLEAPAAAQGDVAGGQLCGARSCGRPSMVCVGTCQETMAKCDQLSKRVVVYEQ
jgi:hypothetical protein